MKILRNNEIPLPAWRDLVSDNPLSTPFQTPEWYSHYNFFNLLSADVVAVSENEQLLALVVITFQKEHGVKGFFSRRSIIYGGPLFSFKNSEANTILIKQIEQISTRRAIYVETRNLNDLAAFHPLFLNNGWKYTAYLNYQLSLRNRSKTDVLELFNYNRRREISRSVALGTTYGLCENINEVVGVYDILQKLYKERVKLPLPELRFFIRLFSEGIIKVFCVKHENKIIGGAFCPFLVNKAIYTFYYCGLREYNRQIYPTHLAILAAIEYAIDNDIPMIDFMGAGKPSIEYGVRQYKSEFGGRMVEDGRYTKILNSFLYRIAVAGIRIKKLLFL